VAHFEKCIRYISSHYEVITVEKLPSVKNDFQKHKYATISFDDSDVKIPELMMSWDDLKELNIQGHYIGSHSVTHPMLERISNENEIRAELLDSGNIIKKNLGYFPLTLAYPIGSYNENVIRICKESGYKIGLATKQDIYNPERDDIFEVPRIELLNEPWWKTLMRITNLLEDVKRKIYYRMHLFLGAGFYELIYEDAAISYSMSAL
ncbi:MAG: polysaccharide deacetylase family protein, partial [Bacteroidota bacterium]|nr:polysaccharide deacetylase family protein [Bacteroidota bacterium]